MALEIPSPSSRFHVAIRGEKEDNGIRFKVVQIAENVDSNDRTMRSRSLAEEYQTYRVVHVIGYVSPNTLPVGRCKLIEISLFYFVPFGLFVGADNIAMHRIHHGKFPTVR